MASKYESETDLQKSIIDFYRQTNQYISYHLLHYPAGFSLPYHMVTHLKKMGWQNGVFDLMMLLETDRFNGYLLELKVGKNVLTPEQKERGKYFRQNGFYTTTAYNFEDATNGINWYYSRHKYWMAQKKLQEEELTQTPLKEGQKIITLKRMAIYDAEKRQNIIIKESCDAIKKRDEQKDSPKEYRETD